MHRTLAEFVAFLRQAQTLPRPDGEEWPAMIARISVTGRVAVIDEETFFYFLEVLPPKYMKGRLFAFAEGAESLRIFWKEGDAHFCGALTWDETQEFCRLTGNEPGKRTMGRACRQWGAILGRRAHSLSLGWLEWAQRSIPERPRNLGHHNRQTHAAGSFALGLDPVPGLQIVCPRYAGGIATPLGRRQQTPSRMEGEKCANALVPAILSGP